MKDELEKCPVCGGEIIEVIENNGFISPDPDQYETVGYECIECEYKRDL